MFAPARLLIVAAFVLAADFPALPSPFDSVWRSLAQPSGFRPGDFDLMINYRGEPVKPLAAVDRLLRFPRSVDSLVPLLRRDLSDTVSGGLVRCDSLWPWLDVALPQPVRREITTAEWLASAEQNLQAYLRPLTPGETAFLRREVPPLLRQNKEDTSLNAIQVESLRLRQDAITDEVMRLAAKLPRGKLAAAARDLDEALYSILADGRAHGWREAARHLQALTKKGIPVEIGSDGPDVHRLQRGIVFDPGGDDGYEFPDSAQAGRWLLVIDLSGNDIYHASDTAGGAAGFLGMQVVADLQGDDRYLGRDLAFGAGVMGYGRLFDAEGDDLYDARCASLGFGFQGLGLLQDRAGNDVYSASHLSQGASSTYGLGVLLDQGGNDRYLARPDFVDDLRYRDHFLNLSQGFSTGFSPRHPGGIGVLWDRGGEDLYSADIFGQGAGYWFAWGLLMDDAGNDKYLAHQYAQGAGVHFAAGTLWDRAGDDLRISKGVSQGCGHDGGFGLLVDESGNDHTVGVDMSMGAGSANGLGVYCDFQGDDIYAPQNPAMTLGYGDLRRDRGSMGFFLDRHGRDLYPPEFKNDSAWRVYDAKRRGYGYGLDGE